MNQQEGNFPQAYRIVETRVETPRVTTLVLDGRMRAEPGQFVMVWLPDLNEKPFSLVDSDPVTLAVARVGDFTEAMHQLGPGDRVWLRGPLGRGFSRTRGRLLVIGGGYGAAPLLFLARRARMRGDEVWAALGAGRADDIFFTSPFTRLGCRLEIATDDGSAGRHGRVTEVAEAMLEEDGVQAMAACGPGPLLDAVTKMGQRRQIHTEVSREAYMRCGIGVCGSCVHEGKLVCKEGPVFTVHQTQDTPTMEQPRSLPDLEITPLS